jgi:pseudaminic acid biosynthesis-associated methylase
MTTDLWRGSFGDAYHTRNMPAFSSSKRSLFWERFYRAYPVASVLEIGCGSGANLRWAQAQSIYGMDVNAKAVAIANTIPGVVVAEQSIFDKRFADGFAELVFSCGVLIHIERERLDEAISEMIRVSSKYVMAMEYDWPEEVAITYHGEKAALWKRPYRQIISERLGTPLGGGFLSAKQGFDRVTWSLWAK